MEKEIVAVKKYKFVSIEGSDGVGKTTVINTLKAELANEGISDVLIYKVPKYDNSTSAKLLKYLFTRDWYLHDVLKAFYPLHILLIRLETSRVERELKQAIELKGGGNGQVLLIGDRSALSNYAYSEIYTDKLRPRLNNALVNFLFKNAMLPDISFLIIASPDEIVKRIEERGESISEAEVGRLTRMQNAYIHIFGGDARSTCKLLRNTEAIIINGNRSKETVSSNISAILRNHLKSA
jgi:thymidylate kinase